MSLSRHDDTLQVEGPLTMQTVPGLVEAAEQHFRAGVRRVNFAGATEVDSSAVALALEWQRQAARHNVALRLESLPEAMLNLATLYGVAELLQASAA
jgi:phospholipid transport system transporter-binding protein